MGVTQHKYKVTVTSLAQLPVSGEEASDENLRQMLWYGFKSLMDVSESTPPDGMEFEYLGEE